MLAVGLWIIVCGNSPSGAANAFKLMLWDEQERVKEKCHGRYRAEL